MLYKFSVLVFLLLMKKKTYIKGKPQYKRQTEYYVLTITDNVIKEALHHNQVERRTIKNKWENSSFKKILTNLNQKVAYRPSCFPKGSSYWTPTQKPGAMVSASPTYLTTPLFSPGSTSHLSPTYIKKECH